MNTLEPHGRTPLRALLATALAAALLAAMACGAEEETTRPSGSPAAPALSPSSDLSALPSPAAGYAWQQVLEDSAFARPSYAVQLPANWVGAGRGNPVPLYPADAASAGLQLLTTVTPVKSGFEHPILFNLPQMGTTCGSGVPRGQMPGIPPDAPDAAPAAQFVGDTFTWNVYYFTCETRLTAADVASGKTPVPFGVRGAEVQVREFIFSVTLFEPAGSATGKAVFEQALRSFKEIA